MFCQKDDLKKFRKKITENIHCGVSFCNKFEVWKPETVRSSHWRCSVKKMFLKISQILQENTCVRVFFCNFIKKTLKQMLSCKICESFQSNYFEEHLWTLFKKKLQHRSFLVNFENFSRTYFLLSIYERLVLHQHCRGLSLMKLQAWRPESL